MLTLPDKPYFRVDEIALHCDVTDRTVRRWIEFGTLKAQKIGGVVRVNRAALVTFLETTIRDKDA